jgi:hypothetical protein
MNINTFSLENIKSQANKTLLILSIPRTGSNLICNIINSLNEFEFFWEVYHNNSVYAPYHRKLEFLEYLYQQKNIPTVNIGSGKGEDIELVEFAHKYPDLFFESMYKTSKAKYLGFKIFQNHLDLNTINNIFLYNTNIVKLILKRNFLDVYASTCIQNKIKKIQKQQKIEITKQNQNLAKTYYNFDTTNIKVFFDSANFIKWLNEVQKYYSFLEKASHRNPQNYLLLNYEELDRYQTDSEKISFIINFLIKSNFNIDENQKNKQRNFLKKQDSRSNILDKFENPSELESFLVSNNLEYLINCY